MKRVSAALVKELCSLKIHDIFDDLGIQYTDRYHSLVAPCPVHHSSRFNSFSYHLDRQIWKCFSRSCDTQYDSDIFGLVKALKKCSFAEAMEYLKTFVDVNMSKSQLRKIVDNRANREFILKSKRRIGRKVIYPESSLASLSYHSYLEERGFSREIVEEYHVGVGPSTGKYMSNRAVFPIRNKNGSIVGFTGRTLLKDWRERNAPKWLHSRDYDSKNNLFNIDRAAEFIKEKEEAIIVEGPLDVLRLEDAGIRNSVAVLGKTLHNEQMGLLMQIPTFKLVLAMDNDAAGKSGMKSALKTANGLFDIKVIDIPNGANDIGELNHNQIMEIFK